MRPQPWSTDVLTQYQLAFVARHLPQPAASTGRPAYTNLELLPGILRVLRSGCRWRDLDQPGRPSGVTHWRRLRFWKQRRHFKLLWKRLLDILVMGKRLDLSLLCIDGTLIPSPAFEERTGYSGKHRLVGVKLSIVVDARGIPLALSLAPGNVHDGALGYLTVKNIYRPPRVLRPIATAASRGPPVLLGDRGYDSLMFRQFVSKKGYILDIPKRRGIPIEPGQEALYAHDPVRFKRRWVVERTHSWLKSFRRLRYRVDRTSACLRAAAVASRHARRAHRSRDQSGTQHGHGRGPRDENVAEVHEGDPAPHTSAAGLRDTARGLPRRCIQDHLYGGATRCHRRAAAPGGGRR
jgi:transposase